MIDVQQDAPYDCSRAIKNIINKKNAPTEANQ